jgi:hemerythrin
MTYIAWSEALSLGIPEIDEQHMEMIGLVNQLNDAMLSRNVQDIGHALDAFTKCTKDHFRFEEQLLLEAGYCYPMMHASMHEFFMRDIEDIRRIPIESEDWAQMMMKLVARWLVRHIDNEDRDYAETVRRHLESAC